MDNESALMGCGLGVIITIVVLVACIFGVGIVRFKPEQPKQAQVQPEVVIAQGYADVGRIEAYTRQQQAQAPITIAILQQVQIILVELAGIALLLAYAYRMVKCSSG